MSGQQTDETATESRSEESADCCSVGRSPAAETVAADVRTLAALGNDTRYEALRLIADADGAVCVCELEPVLGVSQGAVSQALSRLFGADLVERRKEGRWRYYTATPRAERLLRALDETRSLEEN
ncbi:ArsR/SmtB family transcription factor [Natrinema marinum]|uniref:ArsR/SmtB family transcription factor n=1 Tax=Natrinema marinum TaxID=2961598 RepID=UPI0020C91279|nr:metalloregulator ArsR/SmtB family transcription factor [Natrinema marinum]